MKVKNIAKAIVLNPNGEVLLLRRSQTDTRRPGDWDFPGGGVDPGEDMAQAVIREIQEEAGLIVKLGELTLVFAATTIETFKLEAPQSVNRLLFLCHVGTEQAAALRLSYEHDEYQWVPVAQALIDFQHDFYNTGLRHAADNGLLDA